jgi:diguanylate cyclase (GGDEF)-like protein
MLLMIGCINEIGDRQIADNVSGLLGEVAFRRQLNQFRGLPKCFVLRIGIDDFKNVNERLGMEIGDRVLSDVASCITACVQPVQFVYRMISDEFIIFDLLSENHKQVKELYEDIRHASDVLLEQQHYEVMYTLSCGVVSYEDLEDLNYEHMSMLSQFSLSRAKENGKNQIYFFQKKDYDIFVSKREITQELRRAVSRNFHGFELFFQPIVYANTDEIYAAEALIRYRREDGELVPPAAFIPQLEESGLIIPLGRWIIQTAVKACKECQKTKPNFKVSINLSYVQLLKSPLYNDLVEAIEKYKIAPDSIIVELTESGYLEESNKILNIWRKLKRYGVLIAIDDFGTGYSNLSNISDLKPDILKVDREFTIKALKNDYERRLLVHIIEMAHSLGIQEVVEGVEERDELDKMVALGTDYVQGYYYSKPCPIPEFIDRFLKSETA